LHPCLTYLPAGGDSKKDYKDFSLFLRFLDFSSNFFTPYNPESPSLQTGDEGNFKSKDKKSPVL
jgi:hypothetical protein